MNKFFRFYKRIWVPALIILVTFLLWQIIEPLLPAIMQLAFAFLFQLIQIVTWIFLFFGILASRTRIQKYKAGDLDLDWSDYRGNPEVVKRVKAWVDYLKGNPGFDEMGGEHEPGVLMKGKPGTGKASANSALVWTSTGPKKMGDVVIGDFLIGSDGKPHDVLAVYPQGKRTIVKITFNDGTSTRVTPEHLWQVSVRNRPESFLITTFEIADTFLEGEDAETGWRRYRYRIPIVRPVQFEAQDVPISPYLLGVLLGDGGLTKEVIVSSADEFILERVRELIPPDHELVYRSQYDWAIVLKNRDRSKQAILQSHFRDALRNLGLFGKKSEEKFIPSAYLYNSVSNRLSLLQGLMDTDGTGATGGPGAEFSSSSHTLAIQVAWLVRSLGGTASIKTKLTTRLRHCRVFFRLPDNMQPFQLQRKLRDLKPAQITRHKTIVNVELDGQEEATCIFLDSDDHLYATDDFILTHNTWLAKVLASVSGTPLWSVSCQSLLGTFVGIGPLKVKGLFNGIRNEAIKSGKGAILFLDEFDSIGGTRGGWGTPPMADAPKFYPWQTGYWIGKQMPFMGGGMGSQILNVVLEELDGMTEKITWGFRLRKWMATWMGFGPDSKFYPKFDRPRVMVICSTNRPDVLDPALTRRGRVGTDLLVDVPSVEGLEDIAGYYLNDHKHPSGERGIVHDETLTPKAIAQTAAGRTPADIKWFLNTAIDKAVSTGKESVTIHDWMEALAEGVMGTKNPLPLSEEERKLLATHEAGHAIVLLAVAKGRLEPMFLTTERFGGALGHMYPVETLTWYLGATQEMLEGAACMLLAGAASEEVIAGIRHNSMGGDMPGVWRILKTMAWNGMLGRLPLEPEDKRLLKPMREKMNELWDKTKAIVEQNRDVFDDLVPVLVEKRTLAGSEVMELIGEKVQKWEAKDD